ncbi:AraC family transcriptional regulator [Mycobacterium sp. TY815]|uniref:AraC family transcriptional regulator n=1 Tax=Mycobacterium sp. TY815 TaxID=3050581 RepID=UPI002740F2FC|nr:AraC family transcriptional regulator [Mycobacterium sp. TY815]MDP7703093.1 AraC family transcriptional regulator [Mycobacterium sp. TY815]
MGTTTHNGSDPSPAGAALQDAVIPPSVVTGVLDIAEQRGVRTDVWLSGTGLTRSQLDLPATRLSFRQAISILRQALRAMPPGPIGMQVGSRDVLVSWGILGFAVRSCRSTREAVQLGLGLHQAAGTLLNYEIRFGREEFELRIIERNPDPELLPFLCEEACAATVTLMRSVHGANLAPTRIEFAYPAPAYADVYRKFFRCPLRFDAVATRLCFESGLLDRPIPTANPAQLAVAVSAARQLADPGDRRPDMVAAVEGVIRERLPQPVTATMVAERLMISERTLHRRMADAGLRFGEIRDRVRLERAAALLRESTLPIGAVARQVGYSDSREFRRAYLRWTGRTPSAERGMRGESGQ